MSDIIVNIMIPNWLKPEKLNSRKLKPRGRLVVFALIIIGIVWVAIGLLVGLIKNK